MQLCLRDLGRFPHLNDHIKNEFLIESEDLMSKIADLVPVDNGV